MGGEDGEPEEVPEPAGAQSAEDGAGAHLPRLVGIPLCPLLLLFSLEYRKLEMSFLIVEDLGAPKA